MRRASPPAQTGTQDPATLEQLLAALDLTACEPHVAAAVHSVVEQAAALPTREMQREFLAGYMAMSGRAIGALDSGGEYHGRLLFERDRFVVQHFTRQVAHKVKTLARPRERRPMRRRQRHVARSTSSADPGDDPPGEPPSPARRGLSQYRYPATRVVT